MDRQLSVCSWIDGVLGPLVFDRHHPLRGTDLDRSEPQPLFKPRKRDDEFLECKRGGQLRKSIGHEVLPSDIALIGHAVGAEQATVAGKPGEDNAFVGGFEETLDVICDGLAAPHHRRHGPVLAREIAVQLQPRLPIIADSQKSGKAGIRCKLLFRNQLIGPPEQAALLKDRHR